MASLSKETYPSGRVSWVVKYRKPDGFRGTKLFRTHGEARRFKSKAESDLDSGAFVDPSKGRLLLGDLLTDYIDRDFFREMRDDGAGDATIRKVYALIASVLDRAVRQSLLASNPASHPKDLGVPTGDRKGDC